MTYKAPNYEDRGGLDNAYLFRVDQVQEVVRDLYSAARNIGQTDAQAKSKIQDLFNTFAAEWSVYALVGADGIVTGIQNDVTLPWLDTDVAGTSIRQRLINRLS